MSALERLLAEAIPDGTFGGKRHTTPDPPAKHQPPRADPNAAAHYAELAAAINKPAPARARHLHAVPPAA